ncbi:hypothetical protein CANMA_000029 [Candida margitis]|uniref:uncharacterized protein n=1 Tax=Candida margitis TaxID=1775924 RepID=UPI0022267B51|nr:uncharacterized protein CANMA_000029 [Candida margitis]KAI5970869.1 hypothetical protein CANMA_000029 [Candida margitis]
MDEGIANISQRVKNLQLALINAKEESIESQLCKLRSQFLELNEKYPELKTLISLTEHYQIQTPENEETAISASIKEEDISLYRDSIIDAHPDMVEIVNMEPDSIINDINTRITETNLASISQMNYSQSQRIRELFRYYTMLFIKSMIIYEKYVQSAMEVNNFWLEMDHRLAKLTKQIDKADREKQELHRY